MPVPSQTIRMTVFAALTLLASCVVKNDPGGLVASPGGPPPEPGPGPSSAGAPIEAGCSFSADQLQGNIGDRFALACPAGCTDAGGLWGSGPYTADSGLCKAGIHAGAIAPTGGVMTVQLSPGLPAYRGSVRHGIESSDYGSYAKSVDIVGSAGPGPAGALVASSDVIEAGCSFDADQIKSEVGSTHRVNCPASCSGVGPTWGSGPYTADSNICRAAIHAGLLTDAGGMVLVTIDSGHPAYRGSQRNGIASWDFGSYGKSFVLGRP